MNTFEEDIDQIIDQDIYIDLYGFEYKYSEDSLLIEELKLQKKLEDDRLEEWVHYIQSTCNSEDEIFRYIKRHANEESFKEILSYGIHPKFRKEIWTIFLDSFNLDFKKGYYWSLLKDQQYQQQQQQDNNNNDSPLIFSSNTTPSNNNISRTSSFNDLISNNNNNNNNNNNSPTNVSIISSSTDSLKDDDSFYNKSNSITFQKYKNEILSDLERTFPNHPKSLDPEFKEKLKRILFVFSETNPNVGYCQSLNYITFFLLMIIENEEQVFWCLSYITEQLLVEYYNKTMLGSQVDQSVLLDLMEEIFPELNQHLNLIGAIIPVLSMEWFLCLFTVSLPSQATLIIWDNFFVRGSRVLLEVALGLIEMNMNQLMNAKNHLQVTEILSNKPFNQELFKTIQSSYKRIGIVLSKKRILDLKSKHWEITKKQVKEKEEEKDLRHLLKITKFDLNKLKELKEEFDYLSVDGTGIGFLQFQQVILRFLPDWNNYCGENNNSLLFKMFKRIDKDEDNLLNFKELVEALSILSHGNIDQKLKFIFKLFSIEHKDFITRNELKNLIDHVHYIYFEPYLKDYPDEIKNEYLKKKEDFLNSVKEKLSFQDLKQIAYENPLIIESFRISTYSPNLSSLNNSNSNNSNNNNSRDKDNINNINSSNNNGYSSIGNIKIDELNLSSDSSIINNTNSSSSNKKSGMKSSLSTEFDKINNNNNSTTNKRRSDSFHLLNLEGQNHLAIKKEQQKKQEQLLKLKQEKEKEQQQQQQQQQQKQKQSQIKLDDKNLKSPRLINNMKDNINNNNNNNNNISSPKKLNNNQTDNTESNNYTNSILKKLEPISNVANVFKKSGEVFQDNQQQLQQQKQQQDKPQLGESCLIM